MGENKESIYIGLEGHLNLHRASVLKEPRYTYSPERGVLHVKKETSGIFISSKPICLVGFDDVTPPTISNVTFKYAGCEIQMVAISRYLNRHLTDASAVIDLDLATGESKPCAASELFACQQDQKNHWPVIGYIHNQHLVEAAYGDTVYRAVGPVLLSSRNIFSSSCPEALGDMLFELLQLDPTGDVTHHVPKALEEIVLAYEEGTMDSDTYASLGKVHGEAFVSLVCALLEKAKLVNVGFSLPGRLSHLGHFLKTYWENMPPDEN